MSKDEPERELPGSGGASADLLAELYEELRRVARAHMQKERPGQTLQATALVHEAYMRLVGNDDPRWNSRAHFLGAAARAMRRILVEQARRRGRLKRGGGARREEWDEGFLIEEPPGTDLLAVEEALERLEAHDPRKGRLVELRYFAGLTNEETAEALGVSVGTVERDWRFVKTWLQTELREERGE